MLLYMTVWMHMSRVGVTVGLLSHMSGTWLFMLLGHSIIGLLGWRRIDFVVGYQCYVDTTSHVSSVHPSLLEIELSLALLLVPVDGFESDVEGGHLLAKIDCELK